jgi:hypothetical protein
MDYHGAIVLVRLLTKFTARTVALLVVAILVAPAITECAAWAISASGRHACCANRGMASETSMRPCCGMSQQSSEAAPTETQTVRTPLKLIAPQFASVAASFSSRALTLGDSSSLHRASVVPLYLQQASLLI